MSIELRDRNLEIYKRYRAGESFLDLSKTYYLSVSRIRKIVASVRYDLLHVRPDIPEIQRACEDLNQCPNMNKRIQNALKANGYDKQNKWRRLKTKDILKMKNIGETANKVIEQAQKY